MGGSFGLIIGNSGDDFWGSYILLRKGGSGIYDSLFTKGCKQWSSDRIILDLIARTLGGKGKLGAKSGMNR